MVQRLDVEGLLKYEKYRGLILTGAGKNLARKIAHRHKLLTDFLRLLGLDDRVIYHDVEGMEHHISPATLRAFFFQAEDGIRDVAVTWSSDVCSSDLRRLSSGILKTFWKLCRPSITSRSPRPPAVPRGRPELRSSGGPTR